MRLPVAFVLTALIAFSMAPVVTAQTTHEITVVVDESACSDGTFCFEVTAGNPEAIQAGDEVTVTLENPEESNAQHNLYFTTLANESRADGTAAEDAFANTEDLAPGESATLTFTAPEAEGTYWWCQVAGHESLGMWIEAPYAEDPATDGSDGEDDGGDGTTGGDGEDGSGDDDPASESPLGAVALLAAVSLALFLAGRRGN